MKIFRFKKIDAFATGRSTGNPAGVIYLNSLNDITGFEMQKIAEELKGFVNEVGYLCRLGDDLFDLKYYSSEREVDFCGHATVAMMYDLIKNDAGLLEKDVIYINTSKGKLAVSNRIENEDAVFIAAPKPVFSDRTIRISEIAKALRIDKDIIDGCHPISIINAGLETLIVPIGGLSEAILITPDLEELKRFCINQAIDIITVFTGEVADSGNAFRTRVFAPSFGYLEDPATGSGNSAFGYYLLKNERWRGRFMSIEQNRFADNPNIVKLEFGKNDSGQNQVSFGGNAVVRINGEYHLV
jgi:PhzF family phenazine biosynthesis protein